MSVFKDLVGVGIFRDILGVGAGFGAGLLGYSFNGAGIIGAATGAAIAFFTGGSYLFLILGLHFAFSTVAQLTYMRINHSRQQKTLAAGREVDAQLTPSAGFFYGIASFAAANAPSTTTPVAQALTWGFKATNSVAGRNVYEKPQASSLINAVDGLIEDQNRIVPRI